MSREEQEPREQLEEEKEEDLELDDESADSVRGGVSDQKADSIKWK